MPKPMFEENRIGILYIDINQITQNTNQLLVAFRKVGMIPLRAEMLAFRNQLELIAYSVEFDIVEPGLAPPEYQLIYEHDARSDQTLVRLIKAD